nr:TMEM175 family protein [Polymorphobacter sp.]
MAITSSEGTERTTDRLEAFSDAVLAIAITVPVVELHAIDIAHRPDLAAAYAGLIPDYIAYALSVVVIGLYWAHSHFSGKIVEKTDHGFNLLSVLFLALVSVTPLPARPFVEHFRAGLDGDANGRTAAVVYAAALAAPSVAWLVRWLYAWRRHLLDDRLTDAYLHRVKIKYVATAVLSTAGAVIAALIDWRVGFGLTALVTLAYFLPPSKPEYREGQEPDHELEDAGDKPA